jgi:hypothetical protein
MSDASLKEIFDKYAGQRIKDPDRLTCDIDFVMENLAGDVRKLGFIFGAANEKGVRSEGCMVPPKYVQPEYERGADGKLRLTGQFKLGNGA